MESKDEAQLQQQGVLAYKPVVLKRKRLANYALRKFGYTVIDLEAIHQCAFHTIVFESEKPFCAMMNHPDVERMLQHVMCLIIQFKQSYATRELLKLTKKYGFYPIMASLSANASVRVLMRGRKPDDYTIDGVNLSIAMERYCTPFTHVLLVGTNRAVLPRIPSLHFTLIDQRENKLCNYITQHLAQPGIDFGKIIQTTVAGTFCGLLKQTDAPTCAVKILQKNVTLLYDCF